MWKNEDAETKKKYEVRKSKGILILIFAKLQAEQAKINHAVKMEEYEKAMVEYRKEVEAFEVNKL